MEQNKGKSNDTLVNGLEDYCKTTKRREELIRSGLFKWKG